MESFQVAVTHILPLTRIRRARLLARDGQVLVRVGQKLSAVDVVASMEGAGGHVLVDLRRALQLPQNSRLENYLACHVGEQVQAGDVLAQKKGIFRRVVPAPVSGQVAAIQGGQLLIEKQGTAVEAHVGFSGTVVEIIPNRGAIIETNGALLQGVWGNGKVEQGTLINLLKTAHEELTATNLEVSLRGAIISGGYVTRAEVFQMAAQLPLRGMVLAGMTADLVPLVSALEFPVILLEGFGPQAMNHAAYQILTTNEKRDICLNATPWDPFSGERPEAIIPLPAEAEFSAETAPLVVGKRVRILGDTSGHVGFITALHPGQAKLPNRLRTTAASVALETSQETLLVPLTNLDVLE